MTSPRAVAIALLATALALVGCSKPAPAPPKPLRIAAAADLAFAFAEVGTAFGKKTGTAPVFSFGSTGLLAKQLTEGGPFDVFAAANVSFVEQVVKSGACDGATQTLYARGRIVVWTPEGGVVAPPAALPDLADPRFRKVAIANPEHAPYGRAAEQALRKVGAWDAVQPKLVLGENVQQTLKYAQTGNVDAAIVALSLSIATKGGKGLAVDESLHLPIDQAMVVCKHGQNPELGRAFIEFVNAPEGRAAMKRYGFVRAGEAVVRAR